MTQFNQWLKVLVTTSMVMGSYSCSESKTVEEYQAEAQKFLEQKDHKSAIIALKNANTVDTQNAALRFELGNTYLAQGNYASAEKEIEIAQRLGFSEELLLPKLAEIKFKLNKFEDVYQLAESSSTLPDESYIAILSYASISSLFESDRQQAQQYIDRASQISSASIYGQIGKAYLSRSEADVKQALINIEQLIAYAPDLPDTYLLKGHLLQSSKQYLAAAAAFEKYSKMRPKEVQVNFFIAQNYISAQEIKKAEPVVELLLKLAERHPLANQMKAQVEYDKKNYQIARDYAVKAYQQNSNFSLASILAGVSAYHIEEYEQAYQYLVKVKDKVPPGHLVKKLLIEIQLRLGYELEVLDSIDELVESGNADSALLTAASQELLKSGNTEAAQELLQTSIELSSGDSSQIANQGLMKIRLNELGTGIDMLEEALLLDPDSMKAEAGLALGYLTEKQFDKALVIAKKWQATSDKKIHGLLLEGEIAKRLDDKATAKDKYYEILTLDENNIPARYKLALYAHAENNIEQAYEYYRKVLSIKPNHMLAIVNFASLTVKNPEQKAKAIVFYQANIAKDNNDNYAKLGLAYIYKAQKNSSEEIKLYQEIVKSKNSIKGIEVLMGDAYLQLKNLPEATKAYQEYLAVTPYHLAVGQRLLNVYEQARDFDKALALVNELRKGHKNNMGLLLFKVYYQSKVNQSISRVDLNTLKSSESHANHWLLNKILGNQAYLKKDFLAAVNEYQIAYDKAPNRMNVIDLSQSLALSDNKDKSISVLKGHVAQYDDIAIEIMLAGAYLNNGQENQALKNYRDIAERHDNVIVLNNLAFLELQNQNITQALVYAKKALALAPKTPAVLDTYAQVLVADDQINQAMEYYTKALMISKGNVAISINKAKALIINNQANDAIKLLESLNSLNDGEKKQIESLLFSLQ